MDTKRVSVKGGYLDYRPGSGTTIEIFDIAVTGERRKGTGRRLINVLIDVEIPLTCRLIWAITRSTNMIAQEFYEEMGFRVVAVLRNFYKDELTDTVDAIMYGRDIPVKPVENAQ